MLTIDYNSALRSQYQDVEKSKKRLDFFHSGIGRWANSFFLKNIVRKINSILTSQLLQTKGLLTEAHSHFSEIQGKNLNEGIAEVNRLLNLNIKLHSLLGELVVIDKDNKYPEIHISHQIVTETIEDFYSVIRILKKANLKTSKETSELAKQLSSISVRTLEKVVYGN